MKIIQLIPLALLICLVACKKDDPMDPAVTAPDMSFAQTNYETDFHTKGSTDIPELDWNGNVGSLSLDATVQGVNLNALNGVVSWDESLPLGTNNMTVIATNSEGQKQVPVAITNNFAGDFSGGYNYDPASSTPTQMGHELNFNTDGTMQAVDLGNTADGTYTRNESTITAIYSFDNGVSNIAFKGELSYDVNAASLEGFWYLGGEPIDGEESGYVFVELEK